MITRKIIEFLNKNGTSTSTEVCNALPQFDPKSVRSCLHCASSNGRIDKTESNGEGTCRYLFSSRVATPEPKVVAEDLLERVRTMLGQSQAGLTSAKVSAELRVSRKKANELLNEMVERKEVSKQCSKLGGGRGSYNIYLKMGEIKKPVSAVDIYDNFIRERVKQELRQS